MNAATFYSRLRESLSSLVSENGLKSEKVVVRARPLTPEEGIGKPDREDFPILQGVEKLMEARFRGARGQAFTDQWGNFSGTLDQVVNLSLGDNRERAIFIAVLNAFLAWLGKAEGTVHCRNEGPGECSRELESFLERYPAASRVALIGLQPALLQALSRLRDTRACDLNPENIGKTKHEVLIEDGRDPSSILEWADLALVTGTTVTNGTIEKFLSCSIPIVFFGTTISGTASLLGLTRYCPCSLSGSPKDS